MQQSVKDTLRKSTERNSLQNSELLQLQTNAQEQENSKDSGKIIEREKVEGTPFELIKVDEKGWFLAMGKHRFTEPVENKEEILKSLEGVPWDYVMNVIMVVVEYVLMAKENVKLAEEKGK